MIVIGAEPAGGARRGPARNTGYEVAIGKAELGGRECSYYACMPSKALLRPAQALAEARRVLGATEALRALAGADQHMATFGFIIVGLLVTTWLLAIAIWRISRIEERRAARPVERGAVGLDPESLRPGGSRPSSSTRAAW